MKFTADKADLQRAIAFCKTVVEGKTQIPILQNLKLARENEKLLVTATDMDIEITVEIAASYASAPAQPFTIPARTLADVVAKAADDKISIQSGNDYVATITAGRARYKLGTLDAADFPVFSVDRVATEFDMAAGDLLSMINATSYAMSDEVTRYYLGGIFFTTHERNGATILRAVATDGHRLAYMDVPSIDASLENTKPIILPKKAAAALVKIIGDGTEPTITVSFSENKAVFQLPGITLKTKLIDGTYPDYLRVIPKWQSSNGHAATVLTEALAAAVARVICVAEGNSRSVKIAFADKEVTVSARSDKGSAEERLEAMQWSGGRFEIGFNGSYLLEVLPKLGTQVELLMGDPASPALLHTITDGLREPDRLNLLMPVRVSSEAA